MQRYCRIRCIDNIRFDGEQFEDAFRADGGLLEDIIDRRELEKRLVDMTQVDDEQEQIRDRNLPIQRSRPSAPNYQNDSQTACALDQIPRE